MGRNRIVLDGRLLGREALRHTPAGIPALNFRVGHLSEQMEAGLPRSVSLEIEAVALGEVAQQLSRAPEDAAGSFEGFLAQRSRGSRLAVLHVDRFEPDSST
ncbi:MAG TPA: primosomal replication protein N [Burkholderiales bacterium]|nr:primosomal replication protein N [Burkholderiales bacterium]